MPSKNDWLSNPQITSKLYIDIAQPIDVAELLLLKLDFSRSRILKAFFAIAGLSKISMNLSGLIKLNFCLLDQERDKIVLGVKGKFWRLRKVLLPITKIRFLKEETGYSRITWTFSTEQLQENNSRLHFNVAIESPDKKTHRKMSIYWFLIKPISCFVRKEMLRAMKKNNDNS